MISELQTDKLISLKDTYKFSDEVWLGRGLSPSDKLVSDKMNDLINKCLIDLINKSSNNITIKEIKKILSAGLKRFNKIDYDTEEKEFIADKIDEVAHILNISYKKELNIWLYGWLMYQLDKVFIKK